MIELTIILLSWLVLGMALGPLAIPVIAIFVIYLLNKSRLLITFVGFLFILVLSDSRMPALAFSQNLKVVYIIVLLFFIVKKYSKAFDPQLYKPFIPFFIVAFFCLIFSESLVSGISKTLSYFLLFIVVPYFINGLYKLDKYLLLKSYIYLIILILGVGFLLYFIYPQAAVYFSSGRMNGALGNPNGLGIFCLVAFLLTNVIFHYQPHLFTQKVKLLTYGLIIASVIMSGSRGTTISILIFLIFRYTNKISTLLSLLLLVVFASAYAFIEINLVPLIETLGLESYFRLDTLEEAGGRIVAFEFAWEQIQKNFWIGKGFGFTEYIFHLNFQELSLLGHEGNAHNSYLTMWLDTGLIGLLFFLIGWGLLFYQSAKNSFLAFPIMCAVLFSSFSESWLAASLNPFTIQLIIILTLLTNKDFIQGKLQHATTYKDHFSLYRNSRVFPGKC